VATVAATPAAAAGGPPKIPHPVEGRENCLQCHGPNGPLPGPASHADYPVTVCQTCHTRKDEMKPNEKMGDRPDRMAPHRGDYLVTHRIDGRLDPGSCFRCHGNKNDVRCRQCHK